MYKNKKLCILCAQKIGKQKPSRSELKKHKGISTKEFCYCQYHNLEWGSI